ncbi:MAG: cell division protein ZapA [Candidatus Tectomicrobia bacterium]|uniref:Cell division protein ZapA n=1 Tax=Tectimicrobiota bacterium TaxID=2528274 RepID=A0A933GNC5_UNCTE|nr:cell division protein ZapA [Candidatus Tectomicrobia bacterium]
MISGEAEPEYVQRLGHYVDTKMREISEKTPTVSSLKVAILAALNISDELFKFKESMKNSNLAIDKKAEDLLSLLNKEI